MYSNPNCSCDKLQKCKMKNSSDTLQFTDETSLPNNIMESQAENGENANQTQSKSMSRTDFFNEVTGGFQTSPLESDDSFQIVLHDAPRRRLSSDCDSEDSFIVFEDSPDSCYTSNEVFHDSYDESDDSETDANDSGRGIFNKSCSLSKKVRNLADDSLYVDHSGDEVDCANIEDLKICNSVATSDIEDGGDTTAQEKNSPAKRVHFSPNPPKVHVMRVWLYAAKQARCRYWQQFAVDRERFKRRIAEVEMAVSWVLRPHHRSRVRFQQYVQKRLTEKKEREAQEKLEEELAMKNEEEHATDNLDDNNTENFEPEEAGEENFDFNDSKITLVNSVKNRVIDTRDDVSNVTAMEEKRNENDNFTENEVDPQNSTNMGSVDNENNTKKISMKNCVIMKGCCPSVIRN